VPLALVIEAVRSFLTGTPLGGSGWVALARCCGLLLGSFALSSALYRRRTSR
jgi:ABC-2 type transport system permease protein